MDDLLLSRWLLLSATLIFFEIFHPKRILFFLGVASLGVTFVSEYLSLKNLENEFILFIVLSLFSLGFLRYLTRNISPITIFETTFIKNSKVYGQHGVVVETIKAGKKGRVKVGKRIFLAKSNEKVDFCIGQEIKVFGKNKSCFLVERITNSHSL